MLVIKKMSRAIKKLHQVKCTKSHSTKEDKEDININITGNKDIKINKKMLNYAITILQSVMKAVAMKKERKNSLNECEQF